MEKEKKHKLIINRNRNRLIINWWELGKKLLYFFMDGALKVGNQIEKQRLDFFWRRAGRGVYYCAHKVLTYTEHHSVCPLVGIGTLPTPLQQASVPSPPDQRVGGEHPPAPKGVGEFQFRRWRKSLALCLLCDCAVCFDPNYRTLHAATVLSTSETSLSSTVNKRLNIDRTDGLGFFSLQNPEEKDKNKFKLGPKMYRLPSSYLGLKCMFYNVLCTCVGMYEVC